MVGMIVTVVCVGLFAAFVKWGCPRIDVRIGWPLSVTISLAIASVVWLGIFVFGIRHA